MHVATNEQRDEKPTLATSGHEISLCVPGLPSFTEGEDAIMSRAKREFKERLDDHERRICALEARASQSFMPRSHTDIDENPNLIDDHEVRIEDLEKEFH